MLARRSSTQSTVAVAAGGGGPIDGGAPGIVLEASGRRRLATGAGIMRGNAWAGIRYCFGRRGTDEGVEAIKYDAGWQRPARLDSAGPDRRRQRAATRCEGGRGGPRPGSFMSRPRRPMQLLPGDPARPWVCTYTLQMTRATRKPSVSARLAGHIWAANCRPFSSAHHARGLRLLPALHILGRIFFHLRINPRPLGVTCLRVVHLHHASAYS